MALTAWPIRVGAHVEAGQLVFRMGRLIGVGWVLWRVVGLAVLFHWFKPYSTEDRLWAVDVLVGPVRLVVDWRKAGPDVPAPVK